MCTSRNQAKLRIHAYRRLRRARHPSAFTRLVNGCRRKMLYSRCVSSILLRESTAESVYAQCQTNARSSRVTRVIGSLTSSRVCLCARQSVCTGLWIVKPRSRINQLQELSCATGADFLRRGVPSKAAALGPGAESDALAHMDLLAGCSVYLVLPSATSRATAIHAKPHRRISRELTNLTYCRNRGTQQRCSR